MDALKNSLGQHLDIMDVYPSDTNPRKRFPADMINELADSIRKHGVMQPILVRPRGTTIPSGRQMYQVVSGECRLRASDKAEQKTIPAVIRELDDYEAMKLQIIENMHRTDLHPLEEANGFKQLIKTGQWTVETIISTFGKSRSYIYASLKLTELCTYAQDAFYDGKLKRETAILIARIPGEALQTKAVKEITRQNADGEAMSYRAAVSHIQDRYMLDLTKAIFDLHSTSLCADIGSCLSCPKRSGNNPELYSDIGSADVCTDPDCFATKRQSHIAKLESEGKQVIYGLRAKEVAPAGLASLTNYITGGYSTLNRSCDIAGFTDQSYRELLKDDLPPAALVIDEKDNHLEVFEVTALREKLQAKIDSGELVPPSETSEKPNEQEGVYARRQRLTQEEIESRTMLFKAMSQKLKSSEIDETATTALLEILIEENFNSCDQEARDLLQESFGFSGMDDTDFLGGMCAQPTDPARLTKFLMLVIAARSIDVNWDYQNESVDDPEDLMFLLHALDIDVTSVLNPELIGLELPAETAPTPPIAAHAPKEGAPKNPEPGEPAAQAEEAKALPAKLQSIKDKALAKKARKQSKDVSANADAETTAPTANAAEETNAESAANV